MYVFRIIQFTASAVLANWLLTAIAHADTQYPAWPDCGATIDLTAPLTDQSFQIKLCEGIRALETGESANAIHALRNADSMHLFETPNFRALPILAAALKKNGLHQEGRAFIHIAQHTIDIVLGRLACPADESEDGLIKNGERLIDPSYIAAQKRMCGGMYQAYYGDTPENHSWVAPVIGWLEIATLQTR